MSHDVACAQLLLHINESNMKHESKAIPFTVPAPESDVKKISSKFPVEKKQGRNESLFRGRKEERKWKGASNGLRGQNQVEGNKN